MSSSGAGSVTERFQNSLRHSAIARLLIEGRLPDKVDIRVHSPPPPIDLSTTKTKHTTESNAPSSFSLSTISTMEKLRCILTCEMQSLLTRAGASTSSPAAVDSAHLIYNCRLCPFSVSQIIELLAHYRYHNDALANLGHKSPDVITNWFDYYLKTSSLRSMQSPSMTLSDPSVKGHQSVDSSTSSSGSSRLDLRSLLLKPIKSSSHHLVTDDRPQSTRHRASSESHHPKSSGCRGTGDGGGSGGGQSRSSTPYTMTSGLTDDENQQTLYTGVGDRLKRSVVNGRQPDGQYFPGEVSIKCEADETTTSPVRSPLSNYSERSAKEKIANSHCTLDGRSPSDVISGFNVLGQFQNGRFQGLCRMAEEPGPPILKYRPCIDESSSELTNRAIVQYIEDKYLTSIRESTPEYLRKLSTSRVPYPGLRVQDEVRDDGGKTRQGEYPVLTKSPSIEIQNPKEEIEDGQQTERQSKSPRNRETVEQEYAYKQYKRLRKSNAPKSIRQEPPTTTTSLCNSKTSDDPEVNITPSVNSDTSRNSEMTRHDVIEEKVKITGCQNSSDVGIQCSLIVGRPVMGMEDEVDDDEEEERYRRKRAFPADENEMPYITASDADCTQTRCSSCGITFDDDVIFSIHMGCHSHTDPFMCNICGRQCDNKYAFNTHVLRGHHPT